MRYYTDNNTLFIRGSFRIASTGICGGIRSVPTLLYHKRIRETEPEDPDKVLGRVAAGAGLVLEYSGFLSTIPVSHVCILQYDYVTVFISAGFRREPPAGAGGITIIVTSREGFDDTALLEAIMVAAEAKADALHALDLPFSGTTADGVLIACEGDVRHGAAGRDTAPGMRIREAIAFGLPEALRRHDTGSATGLPAFYIFSRFKGEHWIEWVPEKCPYYPCHFPGQACDFCYCPFYPCRDEGLGQWVKSASGGKVWNCATCTLLHEPAVAAHLKEFPMISREELILLSRNLKK